MKIDYRCETNSDGCIRTSDVNYIIKLMREGGLCILPSDSSYILTGNFMIKDVMTDINFLLMRNKTEVSLTFHDFDQVVGAFDLSPMAEEFIKNLTPGGLTFVSEPKEDLISHNAAQKLYSDGTVGIRLSESKVETQLASCFPIPTTPIRDPQNNAETSDLEDAIRIVDRQYLRLRKYRKIAAIKGVVRHSGQVSTVVKEDFGNGGCYIVILREGVIPKERIEKIALECGYDGIKLIK